ncbi:MAG TPA: hypothetical protein VFK13_02370 [Gemmatimonadaceae bacterium]|nr:hypothetical protein [Gemmatimonadaceae bacterium]
MSANVSAAQPHFGSPSPSPIAGSVLPIKRAEELLLTLPGILAARIVAGENGAVNEIHLLTSSDVTPKQTVRNVESALIAHLGMKVDHRKISVATTIDPQKALDVRELQERGADAASMRKLLFEDVEVRRSRTRGVTCKVTLRRGDASVIGEAEGAETERSRAELAARATLLAIGKVEGEDNVLALDGCKLIDAFDREFVFVGISARRGRETTVLAGSCEIRESPETASVLAVLNATNRWIDRRR